MTHGNLSFDDMLAILADMYTHKIPFNRELGMQVISLKPDDVQVRFDMQDKLIGNYIRGFLHGGVISAVLDATGGMTASVGLLEKMRHQPAADIVDRLARVGTIDLRIDYLRPGVGRHFVALSSTMRAGKRVAVTRMELHNDRQLLIAVGTGTYIVG